MQYSWIEFHGAVTHFPIALVIAGFLFEIGAWAFKKPEWRTVSFWSLVIGVLGSAASLASGWIAVSNAMGPSATLPPIVASHRLFGFVSGGAGLVLLLWRAAAKDRLQGPALAASIALFAVATAAVGYTGFLGGQMVFGDDHKQKNEKPVTAQAPSTNAANAKPAATGDPALVAMGQQLFEQQRCANCHVVGKTGGTAGPDLTHEGSDEPDIKWQMQHIQNPAKMNPGSSMPAYATLTQQQLLALATYVVSNK